MCVKEKKKKTRRSREKINKCKGSSAMHLPFSKGFLPMTRSEKKALSNHR